ncbi:MAG TPA: alpha/beta hydrolase [Gaiellaceae bacterium]|nr:alpha/beta hydrolase [Gaiellaceae bacterium]
MRTRLVAVAVVLAAAAALAGRAHGATFTVQDLTIAGAGGTPLAATLYKPTGAPPAGGFAAIVMFHGLGDTHASVDPLARQFFADQGYVVLAADARGHGASGGLWDSTARTRTATRERSTTSSPRGRRWRLRGSAPSACRSAAGPSGTRP